MTKDFKTNIDRTGTTSALGKNLIYTYNVSRLSSERILSHRRSDWKHEQYTSKTNQGEFTQLLSPLNAINKQKRAMRRAMRKPRDLQFKRFAARLTELNNYFPLLLGSRAAKKMDPEANHVSSGSNKKEGASTLPSNPDQGFTSKRKRSNAGHLSNDPTGSKNTCLLHGPRHPS